MGEEEKGAAEGADGGEPSAGATSKNADNGQSVSSRNFDRLLKNIRTIRPSLDKIYIEERNRSNSGMIGRFIGDQSHHVGSISVISVVGILILIFTCLMIIAFTDFSNVSDSAKSIGQSLVALIGTILGYLFGKDRAPPSKG